MTGVYTVKKILTKILYTLYQFNCGRLRKLILHLIIWLEGGKFRSLTLRKIFKDYHNIDIGLYSYGCFELANIPSGTSIGRYCSFAEGVVIMNANHPLNRRSLHPFFYNPSLGIVSELKITRGCIEVGHDVWIGRNALILPHVKYIGNGAVIGAGAIVTKNVPAYAVVAGNPAKIIRYRFPEQIQKEIEESRWWEKSIEELQEHLEEYLKVLPELP